jgi:hypothetical protein
MMLRVEGSPALSAVRTELTSRRPAKALEKAEAFDVPRLLREYAVWFALLGAASAARTIARQLLDARVAGASSHDLAVAVGILDDTGGAPSIGRAASGRAYNLPAIARRDMVDRILPYSERRIASNPTLQRVQEVKNALEDGRGEVSSAEDVERILRGAPFAAGLLSVELDLRLIAADLAARHGDQARAAAHLVALASVNRGDEISPLEHVAVMRGHGMIALPELRSMVIAGTLGTTFAVDVADLDQVAGLIEAAALRRLGGEEPERRPDIDAAGLVSELARHGGVHVPPASGQALDALERRLHVTLPSSYRSFLAVANGFGPLAHGGRLLAASEVGWLSDLHPEELAIWAESRDGRPVTDAEYGVYGSRQDPTSIRVEHLSNALVVGDSDGLYLLMPTVTTGSGEWEAWHLVPQLGGASRYRMFSDMLEAEVEAASRS